MRDKARDPRAPSLFPSSRTTAAPRRDAHKLNLRDPTSRPPYLAPQVIGPGNPSWFSTGRQWGANSDVEVCHVIRSRAAMTRVARTVGTPALGGVVRRGGVSRVRPLRWAADKEWDFKVTSGWVALDFYGNPLLFFPIIGLWIASEDDALK